MWLRSAWSPFERFAALTPIAREYDHVYAELRHQDLIADDQSLDNRALEAELFGRTRGSSRFLGFYSECGLKAALERYGLFEALRRRGFDPVLHLDLSDPDEHRLFVHDGEVAPDRLLVEVAAGLSEIRLPSPPSLSVWPTSDAQNDEDEVYKVLFVNWLKLQNPRASFTPGRPALRGQDYPGLGMFPQFAYLLKLTADRLGCEGVVHHPAYAHLGVLYGRVCSFVDPEVEGRFRALERDVGTRDLARLTDVVARGLVVDQDGVPMAWEPAPQLLPVSRRIRRWFRSSAYRKKVAATEEAYRYRVLDGGEDGGGD